MIHIAEANLVDRSSGPPNSTVKLPETSRPLPLAAVSHTCVSK